MALDILHDNWGPYSHTEVENALKAYLTVLENRINQAIQSGGVGLADLSAEVQALLNKANTALQPESIAAWAKAQNKPGYTVSEITGVEGFQNLLAKLQDMDAKIQAAAASGGVDPDDEMSSTSEKPVQNKVIKAYVDAAVAAAQNALNNLIGGNVQDAIDTFNEVVAFLDDIDTSDPTLKNQLLALNNAITNLGNSLSTVATSGSYNDLTDKPTKVSELENDEGYITAEEVGDIVAITGDIAIVENSDFVDIMIYSPEMSVKLGGNEVSSLAFFSDPTQQESLSLAVSGSHLKANIVATLEGTDANKFSISGSPITQSGGAASGTLTVAYTGTTAAGQSANATLKLTCGDLVKTISLHYAYASGPFISVNPASLSFKAATGSAETKTLDISASQLTGDVVVSTPSGSTFQVCATENGTYGNSVTVAKADAEAGKTIYVKYIAGSSAASASVTVSSTDATSRTVELIGAVSTISVSKQTMSFSTDQGVAVTDSFTVEGANLNEDISIVASGTGFSVSPTTIDKDNAGTAQTVTVTYNPSAAGSHTGTVTIQSSGLSQTIALSGSAVGIPEVDGEGKFTATVGGKDFYCKVISGTTNVEIHNSGYVTGYNATLPTLKYSGDVVVPSKVTAIYNNVATEFTVVKLAANSFKSCSGLTSLTLPNTLTEIGLCAINDCSNNSFTSLVIPNSVTTLGLCPVYKCQKLTSLVIGTGVATLTNFFGAGCLSLSSINIPDNVTEINDYCFSGGVSGDDGNIYFDTVTIGSGLTKISGNSKFKMKAGSAVTINRATPPTLNGNAFVDTSGSTPCGATLYVPSGKVAAYQGNSAFATQFGTSNIQEIQ